MQLEDILKLSIVVAILALFASLVTAQKIGEKPTTPRLRQAAVLPILFFEDKKPCDNKTAIRAVTEEIDSVLSKSGIEQLDPARVAVAWSKITGQQPNTQSDEMPKDTDLLALGKALGVDLVICGRVRWHVKSVWVTLGPKTKADATVDFWVINTAKGEFDLKAEGVKADSTKKEDAGGVALDVFVAPVTMVSGGPKTPHMQRSGQIATIDALKPWIEKLQSSG